MGLLLGSKIAMAQENSVSIHIELSNTHCEKYDAAQIRVNYAPRDPSDAVTQRRGEKLNPLYDSGLPKTFELNAPTVEIRKPIQNQTIQFNLSHSHPSRDFAKYELMSFSIKLGSKIFYFKNKAFVASEYEKRELNSFMASSKTASNFSATSTHISGRSSKKVFYFDPELQTIKLDIDCGKFASTPTPHSSYHQLEQSGWQRKPGYPWPVFARGETFFFPPYHGTSVADIASLPANSLKHGAVFWQGSGSIRISDLIQTGEANLLLLALPLERPLSPSQEALLQFQTTPGDYPDFSIPQGVWNKLEKQSLNDKGFKISNQGGALLLTPPKSQIEPQILFFAVASKDKEAFHYFALRLFPSAAPPSNFASEYSPWAYD